MLLRMRTNANGFRMHYNVLYLALVVAKIKVSLALKCKLMI